MIHLGKSLSAKRGCGRSFAMGFLAFWATALVTTGTNAAITEFLFSTEEPLDLLGSTRTSRMDPSDIGKYRPNPDPNVACASTFFSGVNPYEPLGLLDGLTTTLGTADERPVPAFEFGGHIDAVHVLTEVFDDVLGAADRGCEEAIQKTFLVSLDETTQIVDVPLAQANQLAQSAPSAEAQAELDARLAELLAHPGSVYNFEPSSQTATLFLDHRKLFWDQPQADIDAIYQGTGSAGGDLLVLSVREDVALYKQETFPADQDTNICEAIAPAAAAPAATQVALAEASVPPPVKSVDAAPVVTEPVSVAPVDATSAFMAGGYSANMLLRPILSNVFMAGNAVLNAATAAPGAPEVNCQPGLLGLGDSCSGDTDEDTPVVFSIFGQAGYTTVTAPALGTFADIGSGNYSYTPNPNVNGTDSFTVRRGLLTAIPVTITINPVNDPPVAEAGSGTTNEETPLTGTLVATDPDTADLPVPDVITYSIVPGQGLSKGSVTLVGSTYTYNPAPDEFGTDFFVFRATDSAGEFSDARIGITIINVEDFPVARSVLDYTTPQDTAFVGAVTATDGDPGETFTFEVVPGSGPDPAAGTLSFTNATGDFTFTPAPGYVGPASFQFNAFDTSGDPSDLPGTITITVEPVTPELTCPTDTYTQQDIHVPTGQVRNDYAPNKVPGDADGTDLYNPLPSGRDANLLAVPPQPAGLQYPLSDAGAPASGPDVADFADPNDLIQYSRDLGTSRLLFDLDDPDDGLTVKVWSGTEWVVPNDGEVNITGVHLGEYFIDTSKTPPQPVICQSSDLGDDEPDPPTRTVNVDACPIIFSVDRPIQVTLDGVSKVFTEKDFINYQPAVTGFRVLGIDATFGVGESIGVFDADPDDGLIDGDMRPAMDGDVGREQLYGLSLEGLADPGTPVPSEAVLPSVRTLYFTTTSEDQLATTTYPNATQKTVLEMASRDFERQPYQAGIENPPPPYNQGPAPPEPFGHDHDDDRISETFHAHHFNFDAVHRLADNRIVFSNQDPIILEDSYGSAEEVQDLYVYNGSTVESYTQITTTSGVSIPLPTFPEADIDAYSENPDPDAYAVYFSVALPDTGEVPWSEIPGTGQGVSRDDIVEWDNGRKASIVFDGSKHFTNPDEDIDAVHWLATDLYLFSVGGDGATLNFGAGIPLKPEDLVWVKMNRAKIESAVVVSPEAIADADAISSFLPQYEMPNTGEHTPDTYPYSYGPEADAPFTITPMVPNGINLDAIWVTPNPEELSGIDHFEVIPDALTGVSCLPLPVEIRASGPPSDTGEHPDFTYTDTIEIKATDGAGVLVPSSITLGQEKNPDGTLVTDAGGEPVQEDGVLVDSGTLGACDAGVANDGKYCYQFPSAGDTSVNLLLQPLVEPAAGQTVDINLDVLGIPDGKTEGFEETGTDGVVTRTEDPTMSFGGVALQFCEGTPDGNNPEWCNNRISVQVSGKTSDEVPTHGKLYLRLISSDATNPLACTQSEYAQTRTVLMAYECVDPGTCRAGEDVTVDGVTISEVSEGYTVVTLTPENPSDSTLQPYLPYEFQYPEAGVLKLYAQMIRPIGPYLTTPVAADDTLESGTILPAGTVLPTGTLETTTTLTEDTTASTPIADEASLEVAEVLLPAELTPQLVYISAESEPFVVRPFAYRFSNIQETAAPNKTNPEGSSVTGNGFIPAASEFDYTIQAITWEAADDDEPNVPQDAHIDIEPADADGDEHPELLGDLTTANQITENFTALTGQTVTHSIESYSPTGGGRVEGALGISASDADGDGNFTAITEGTGTLSQQTYSEVGSIILRATTPDYFESVAYERNPGTGPDNDVWGISPVIGRFYPFDFLVSGSFSESGACTDGFVYMDEPDAIGVNVFVTAKNVLGETTVNYDNVDTSYAYTATLSPVLENGDDGINRISRTDIDLSGVTWSDGSANYSGSHTFYRDPPIQGAPDGPYPSLQLGVILNPNVDPVVIVGGEDMNASQPDDCTNGCDAKKVGDTLDVRYGRMDIADAYSNSTDDVGVIFRAEYFDSVTNQFVLNRDDQCSVFGMGPGGDPDNPSDDSQQFGLDATNTATNETDSNSPGPNDFEVDAGTTFGTHIFDPDSGGSPDDPVTNETLEIKNGYAELFLRAPGEGSKGYVDVTLQELLLRDSWLSFDWNGDGSIVDGVADYPVGRVTFGRYEGLGGDGRVRYWKEIFR